MTEFEDSLRGFVSYSNCPCCGQSVRVFQPLFKLFLDDFICQSCRDSKKPEPQSIDTDGIAAYTYSLMDTSDEILDLPMIVLGIPHFHVLPVKNTETGEIAYFELTKDIVKILPSYAKKHSIKE